MSLYISVTEYLMGRVKLEDLPYDSRANLNTLIPRVNDLLEKFGKPRAVSSGYRSASINEEIGGKLKSKHMICAAVDLVDHDQQLKGWLASNPKTLEDCDLYMEHPNATPTWVHLQCIPPYSKRRIFFP